MRARDPYGVSPLLDDLAHIATALMIAVNAVAWPAFLIMVLS